MAYIPIPTRTTEDPNSAADINQLQDNIDYLNTKVAPPFTVDYTPYALHDPETGAPEITTFDLAGSHVEVAWYANWETLYSQFIAPGNLDPDGNMTVIIEGLARVPASGSYVSFAINVNHSTPGEPFPAEYIEFDFGDVSVNAGGLPSGMFDEISLTIPIASTGVLSGDQVFFDLWRMPASHDSLSGDYGVTGLRIMLDRG
jgi:hypothetical protein